MSTLENSVNGGFSLNYYPDEILELIFTHLSLLDRIRFRLVCKRWKRISLRKFTEFYIGLYDNKHLIRSCISPNNRIFIEQGSHLALYQGFCFLVNESKRKICKLSLQIDLLSGFRTKKESATDFHKGYRHLANMIRIVVDYCPKLVCIDLGKDMHLPKSILEMLLTKIGSQLVEFHCSTSPNNMLNTLLTNLNPNKLRKLSLRAVRPEHLNQICGQFPLLVELTVFNEITFNLNLNAICTLNHLRCLRLDYYTARTDDCVFFGKFVARLSELGRISLDMEQHLPLLIYWSSLHCLNVRLFHRNFFDQIMFTLSNLRELNIILEMTTFQDHFERVALLKNLKVLRLDLHFNYQQLQLQRCPSMPSLQTFELFYRKSCLNLEQEARFFQLLPIFPNLKSLKTILYSMNVQAVINCLAMFDQLVELLLTVPENIKTRIGEHLKPSCKSRNVPLIVDTIKPNSNNFRAASESYF